MTHTKIPSEMTDAELYTECAKAIRRMANEIVQTFAQLTPIAAADPELLKAMLVSSVPTAMNGLGDICNAMDISDGDEFMDGLFDEMNERSGLE